MIITPREYSTVRLGVESGSSYWSIESSTIRGHPYKIVTWWEYDNQKINVFVFNCIRVECLRTLCSILFGFRKCNKINSIAHPLRIPGISVTSTPGTLFFHFCSINTIDASFGSSNVSLWRWNLKMSEFRSPCNWYSTAMGSSAFERSCLLIGQFCPRLQAATLEDWSVQRCMKSNTPRVFWLVAWVLSCSS